MVSEKIHSAWQIVSGSDPVEVFMMLLHREESLIILQSQGDD